MSRAYRIAVSHGVSRVVHLSDGVSTKLELLGILPQERMNKLLLDELDGRGFDTGNPAKPSKDLGDDIRMEFDLEKGEVSLKLEGLQEVKKAGEFETMGDTDYGSDFERQAKERLKNDAERQLSKEVDQEEKKLQAKATKALESRLRGMKAELDEVVKKVTGKALKEKARSMGEVTELSESENGELSIRVKL